MRKENQNKMYKPFWYARARRPEKSNRIAFYKYFVVVSFCSGSSDGGGGGGGVGIGGHATVRRSCVL